MRCVCLLRDGDVTIMSPPLPPAQPPRPLQLLRHDSAAEAVTCSAEGAVCPALTSPPASFLGCCGAGSYMAVASRTMLHVYALAEDANVEGICACLHWSISLNAHVRGLAIRRAPPCGSPQFARASTLSPRASDSTTPPTTSASASTAIVAVAGAPGLSLMIGRGRAERCHMPCDCGARE